MKPMTYEDQKTKRNDKQKIAIGTAQVIYPHGCRMTEKRKILIEGINRELKVAFGQEVIHVFVNENNYGTKPFYNVIFDFKR